MHGERPGARCTVKGLVLDASMPFTGERHFAPCLSVKGMVRNASMPLYKSFPCVEFELEAAAVCAANVSEAAVDQIEKLPFLTSLVCESAALDPGELCKTVWGNEGPRGRSGT